MKSVEEISNALKARIKVVLPDHKELDFSYFPEKNNFYNNFLRYGVTVSAANSTATITKALSFNHDFKVILTDCYKATDEDELDLTTRIYNIQDRMSDILKNVYWTNLGLINLVFQVTPIAIEAPLIIEPQQLIILTASLNVNYRLNLI